MSLSCLICRSEQLIQLVKNSGFTVLALDNQWMPRCTTIVLSVLNYKSTKKGWKGDSKKPLKTVNAHLKWLKSLSDSARTISNEKSLGIFGTSIAGTWLANVLGAAVHFFVDEDRQRIGKEHLGKKVLPLTKVPKDSSVYLAFPPKTASQIYYRLKRLYPSLKLILPPPYL